MTVTDEEIFSTTNITASLPAMSDHRDRYLSNFLNFPTSDHPGLLTIIRRGWSKGIQPAYTYGGSYQVTLNGNPWKYKRASADNSLARRLIRMLLEGLYGMGWIFDSAVQVYGKADEKDTLIFTKYTPTTITSLSPPLLHSWFIISLDPTAQTLTIQRDPPSFSRGLINRLGDLVKKTTEDDVCIILKFWKPVYRSVIAGRVVLVVREVLEECRFRVYAGVRISGKGEGDVLVCCKAVGESDDSG